VQRRGYVAAFRDSQLAEELGDAIERLVGVSVVILARREDLGHAVDRGRGREYDLLDAGLNRALDEVGRRGSGRWRPRTSPTTASSTPTSTSSATPTPASSSTTPTAASVEGRPLFAISRRPVSNARCGPRESGRYFRRRTWVVGPLAVASARCAANETGHPDKEQRMRQIAYVNGEYVPAAEARISVFDRGFLFGDGVYEVTAVVDRRLVDIDSHFSRLQRSLTEIGMSTEMDWSFLLELHRELIRRNDLVQGVIYLQITRGGQEERDFLPKPGTEPTVVAFAQHKDIFGSPLAKGGATVKTMPDLRWARRDIKSVNLLPSVLAKSEAARSGAHEVWMLEDDFVTEGGSSTAFIVKNGVLVTRAISHIVLPGCTRLAVLALAERHGVSLELRRFGRVEAYAADEAFFTSASSFVVPVVKIDDVVIANGVAGPVTMKMQDLYREFAVAA
jgi:D-alanine transaminase